MSLAGAVARPREGTVPTVRPQPRQGKCPELVEAVARRARRRRPPSATRRRGTTRRSSHGGRRGARSQIATATPSAEEVFQSRGPLFEQISRNYVRHLAIGRETQSSPQRHVLAHLLDDLVGDLDDVVQRGARPGDDLLSNSGPMVTLILGQSLRRRLLGAEVQVHGAFGEPGRVSDVVRPVASIRCHRSIQPLRPGPLLGSLPVVPHD
jgi:hypothetical protein